MADSPALSVHTERLTLIAISAAAARAAAAEDRGALNQILDADAPDEWPGDVLPMLSSYADALELDPSGLGWGPWLIIDTRSNEIVGDAGFKGAAGAGNTVEIGFGTVSAHRGRGIATEAARGLIEWCFAHEHVTTVLAESERDNHASARVLEKSGLRRTGGSGSLDLWRVDRGTGLGWDERWQEVAMAHLAADRTIARVVRVDRGVCSALVTAGGDELRIPHATVVAVGDWIVVEAAGDASASPLQLLEILPRRGELVRGSAGTRTAAQIVAANVDVALIVCSSDVDVNLRQVERFLALAWQGGATPVVVLSKADLVSERDMHEIAAEVNSIAIGVDVVPIDTVNAGGLDSLLEHLRPGRTAVLLGQSGVGKSTLVNALLDTSAQAVQSTRDDGKGRHTTTHRELLVLPGGALLIDTPGIRELQLWDADEGVSRAFEDIEALATRCRFNDCSHQAEPGCAVLAGIESGDLDATRLESYERLQRELASTRARHDTRAGSDRRREIVVMSRQLRRDSRDRNKGS